MIFILTTPIGSGHIDYLIQQWDRSYGRWLVEMTYGEFLRRGRAESGTYVFTDRIRMSEQFREAAIQLWDQLAGRPAAFRLFNDPRTQLGRFELLRKLFERGLNPFNIHRLQDLADSEPSFPVFLRVENDHNGPRTDLLSDTDELWAEAARLALEGHRAEDLVAIEFVDVREPDGVCRKYGAWRIGPHIMGQSLLVSEHWNVKAERRIKTDAAMKETDDYYLDNPHESLLMPFFEEAGIEYGRVDYSMLDGKVVVWEINDNPQFFAPGARMKQNKFGKGERFMACLKALDQPTVAGGALPVSVLASEQDREPVA